MFSWCGCSSFQLKIPKKCWETIENVIKLAQVFHIVSVRPLISCKQGQFDRFDPKTTTSRRTHLRFHRDFPISDHFFGFQFISVVSKSVYKVMDHFLESSCHSWIGFSPNDFLLRSSVNLGFFKELLHCRRACSEALRLEQVFEEVSHGFVWLSTSSTTGRYLAFLRVLLKRLLVLASPDYRLDWFTFLSWM